jgi:hypothetical protein
MDKCKDCGCELDDKNTSYEDCRCDDCIEAEQDEDYEDEE